MSITDTIARVRSFAAHMGWKKGRYAREANIQKTTLRDFNRPEWNPTRETLERLESIIPNDFDPSVAPRPTHPGTKPEQRAAS